MHLYMLCLISITVELYGLILARGYQTNLKNSAARILIFSSYETSSSVLLDELGWDKVGKH